MADATPRDDVEQTTLATDGGFECEESEFERRISTEGGIRELLTDLEVAIHNMWVDVREEIGYSGEYHPATVELTVSITSGGYETDGGTDGNEKEPEVVISTSGMDDEDADRIEQILLDGGIKPGVISRE